MMADGAGQLTVKTCSQISEIAPEKWDALANPEPSTYNPFMEHAFLSALETSKSVSPEAGWAPMHLIIEEAGDIVGVVPLYLKGHSQGEYIFDHHWADAYARHGQKYYPKLLSAIPFTPATGPRLAIAAHHRNVAAAALRQIGDQLNVSSVHVNFIGDADRATLSQNGFLERIGEQYHWFNRGYESFNDFLGALSSRKRKAVRRERAKALEDGITIRHLRGAEITDKHWDAFWLFYQDTGARKWGQPYLTRTFFRLIAETMPERLLFIVAERDGEAVAGALNLIGGDALYGRYWGCREDVPFLHFEICYYQAIDFAIANNLARVEAGAQGQHKIARGYEPVATYSAHWIADEGFRSAIARYLDAERDQNNADIELLKTYVPFKKENGAP